MYGKDTKILRHIIIDMTLVISFIYVLIFLLNFYFE